MENLSNAKYATPDELRSKRILKGDTFILLSLKILNNRYVVIKKYEGADIE
tara:strand:- start:133 stop:285 length:153 start_codon:yes stop_codon:yes gene_type:complete